MAFTLSCPACQNSLQLESNPTAGQRIQCPTCGEEFNLIHGLPHAIQAQPKWSVDFGPDREERRYRPGSIEKETVIPTQAYPPSTPSVRLGSKGRWLPTLLLLTLAGLMGWGVYRFWNARPRTLRVDPAGALSWLSYLPPNPEMILGVQTLAIPPQNQRGPVWERLIQRQTKGFLDFAPQVRQLLPLTQRYLLVENRSAFGVEKMLILEGQQPFPNAHVRELLQAGPPQKMNGQDGYPIPLANPEGQALLFQPAPKTLLIGEIPEKDWWAALTPGDPVQRLSPILKEMLDRVEQHFFWAIWSPNEDFEIPFPLEDPEYQANLFRVQRVKGFFLGLHPEKNQVKLVLGIRCMEEEDALRLYGIGRRLWPNEGQEGLKAWSRDLRQQLPDFPWDNVIKEVHSRVQFHHQGSTIQATLVLPDASVREVEKLIHVLQQIE